MDRARHNPVMRRAHLMTPQLIPSPLPSKDGTRDEVEDVVEELAMTPTTSTSLNIRPPITLATEFGHMVGHRMSVAPISDMASSPPFECVGDTLPGSKARKILGIRTSSGFEDSEFQDDPRTMLSRSRSASSTRSPSPSFMHAMSNVVRRASAGKSSSSFALRSVPERRRRADSQTATDYATMADERRVGLTNIFLRSSASKKGDEEGTAYDGLQGMPYKYKKVRSFDDASRQIPDTRNAGDRLAQHRPPKQSSAASPSVRLPSMLIQKDDDFEIDTLDAMFQASSASGHSDSDADHTTSKNSDINSARSSFPSSIWSCETGSSMSLNDIIGGGESFMAGKRLYACEDDENTRFLRPRPAPAPPNTPFSNAARLDVDAAQDVIATDSELDSDSVKTDEDDDVERDDPLRMILNAETPQELQKALESGQFGTSKARTAKSRPPPLSLVDPVNDLCQRQSHAIPVDERPDMAVTPGRIAVKDLQAKKAAAIEYDSDDALDNIILDLSTPPMHLTKNNLPLPLPPKSPFRRPRRYQLPI